MGSMFTSANIDHLSEILPSASLRPRRRSGEIEDRVFTPRKKGGTHRAA
jgi:hypothetical protein